MAHTWIITEANFRRMTSDSCGLCRACGEEQEGGCEPDARRYPCGACGEERVYGAEECLLRGWIAFTPAENERESDVVFD